MPESLMHAKIKEALIASGNNRHDALKLLITWTIRDHALLLAMTKPHLKAIAAGHIDHFLRKPADTKLIEDFGSENLSRRAIDDIVSSPRSERRTGPAVPPPKSSERQASAMRKLAEAFTRKKK